MEVGYRNTAQVNGRLVVVRPIRLGRFRPGRTDDLEAGWLARVGQEFFWRPYIGGPAENGSDRWELAEPGPGQFDDGWVIDAEIEWAS